ncbi:MAG UNVERIFIED_CONTAM: hypothetical protein LVR29_19760 [Microcystis novacekii LVE1205-3]
MNWITNFGGGKNPRHAGSLTICAMLWRSKNLPRYGVDSSSSEHQKNPQNVNIAVLVGTKVQPSGIPP